SIEHSHLKIRKFKQRPKQCFQCYVYGHVVSKCPNEACCRNCSGNHEKTDECSLPAFCFHCSGSHSPSSKKCPKYQLEEKILELAYDEKISFGAARYLIGESDQPYKTILKKPVKPSTQTNGNKQSSPEKAEQSSKPAKKTSEKEKEAETPDVDSPKATKSDGFWKVPSDKKNSSSHGAKEAETTSSQRESSFVTRNRFSALEDESDVESQEDMDDEPISNSESRKRTLETSSPTNKNKKTNINTSRSNLKSINDQSKCQKSNKSPEAMPVPLKEEKTVTSKIPVSHSSRNRDNPSKTTNQNTQDIDEEITPSPILGTTHKQSKSSEVSKEDCNKDLKGAEDKSAVGKEDVPSTSEKNKTDSTPRVNRNHNLEDSEYKSIVKKGGGSSTGHSSHSDKNSASKTPVKRLSHNFTSRSNRPSQPKQGKAGSHKSKH
ncbi:MAG: hypothetical protein AAFW00_28510, partial [Bacteroidota bacterium]